MTVTGITTLPPPYLLLLLLLVLLCEEGVHPPDLGEHAAVRQAEAEAEEPQTELREERQRQDEVCHPHFCSRMQVCFKINEMQEKARHENASGLIQ